MCRTIRFIPRPARYRSQLAPFVIVLNSMWVGSLLPNRPLLTNLCGFYLMYVWRYSLGSYPIPYLTAMPGLVSPEVNDMT